MGGDFTAHLSYHQKSQKALINRQGLSFFTQYNEYNWPKLNRRMLEMNSIHISTPTDQFLSELKIKIDYRTQLFSKRLKETGIGINSFNK